MKTACLLSLLLVLFSSITFAEKADTAKRIHFTTSKGSNQKATGTRSVLPLDVLAYLDTSDNILVVNLGNEYDKVIMQIRSILTNEIIYSELHISPDNVGIDLSEAQSGDYLLEIFLGETLLYGVFTVE